MIRLSSCLLALCLAGCASTVDVRPMTLPLPARPTLPTVKAAAVQCLAPDAYTSLVDRERALRTWGEKLEGIIQANNAKAKQ